MVPNSSSPRLGRARAARRCRRAASGSSGRRSRSPAAGRSGRGSGPGRRRRPSSRTRRSVRVSCQTIALCDRLAGAPVPEHRGLALVGDADARPGRPAPRPACAQRAGDARSATLRQISSASCSTQPGRGKICRCSRWATATIRPPAVEEDAARRGGALVDGGDVLVASPRARHSWFHLTTGWLRGRGRRARAASRTWSTSSGCGRPSGVAEALDRPGDADRADAQAAPVRIGAAIEASPSTSSSSSAAQPRSRTASSSSAQRGPGR